MKTKFHSSFVLLAALGFACLASSPLARASDWNNPGSGFWDDPANWIGGVPDAGGGWAVANVSNGGTAVVSNTVPNVNEAWAGSGATGGAGNITINAGGTLTVINRLVVAGMDSSPTACPLSMLTIDGGTLTKGGQAFNVGESTGGITGLGGTAEVIAKGDATIILTSGWFSAGAGGYSQATITLQDNAVLDARDLDFNIGDWGNSRVSFTIKDNAQLTISRLWVGKWDNAVGVLHQSGGAIVGIGGNPNEWIVGGAGNGQMFAFYDKSGGTLDCRFHFQLGAFGRGISYQTGGTNTFGSWTSIGRSTGGLGVMWISGGRTVHTGAGATHMQIGEQTRGELTLSGSGILDCSTSLVVGHGYDGNNGTGFLNLNGGTAYVQGFERFGTGSGYVNFNGATVTPKASNASFMSGLTDVRVYAGNAIFDTAGYNITIAQSLNDGAGIGVTNIPVSNGGAGYLAPPIVQIVGDGFGATAVAEIDPDAGTLTNIVMTCLGHGYSTATVALLGGGGTNAATAGTPIVGAVNGGGVIKSGAGTLTLTGTNTYTGSTVVSQGILVLTPNALVSGPVTVADGVGFGVALIYPDTQLGVPSLALGTSGATALNFDLGSFGNPCAIPLWVTNDLAVNGTVTVNLTDGKPQLGLIPLLAYGSRSGAGTFLLGILPPGVQATLVDDTSNKLLYVNVTAYEPPDQTDPLANALDASYLTWTTGGDANWFAQTTNTQDGVDAAASGTIAHNTNTWLQTTVTVPDDRRASVSFWWRVSSETNHDALQFYIDGVWAGEISGEVPWEQNYFDLPSGTHTLLWLYAKDASDTEPVGADRGWVDQVQVFLFPTMPLAVALDTTNLTWRTGGAGYWFGQTTNTQDGVGAAASGPILDDQFTWLQTTVTVPDCKSGTVSFWWQVSSETNHDGLNFYIDDVPQCGASGEVPWQQRTIIHLPSGSHTLTWLYTKDDSGATGADQGWVDQVQVAFEPVPLNFVVTGRAAGSTDYDVFGDATGPGIGTTTYDATPNQLDGTLVNGPTRVGSTLPFGGYALAFDGVDDLVLTVWMPVSDSFLGFTVEFWAQRGDASSADQWLVSQGTAADNQGLRIGFRQNKMFFGFWGNDLQSTNTVTDTGWHHWALTFNAMNKQRSIYRDGVLEAQDTAIAGYQGSGPLFLGTGFDATGYFKGSLDEVRLWNMALSPEGVQALMNQQPEPDQPALTAYYHFDEAQAAFSFTAYNACQTNVLVTCTPPLNNIPLGSNTVTCLAVDVFGVTNTASFAVWLRDARPPVIVTQPASQDVRPGTNVTFSVAVTGGDRLYQWSKDGTNLVDGGWITGATSGCLTISNVVAGDGGQYSVALTNIFGGTQSSNATLWVGTLDHFAWATITSPQAEGTPFPVSIEARDASNNLDTNFTGTVALSGSTEVVAATNNILGDVVPSMSFYHAGTWTMGYRFTPNTNLTVTHVRHYFGSKVSIWTTNGTLLAAQNVVSVPGTWVETPLAAPIQLINGTNYVVGVYFANTDQYQKFPMPAVFPYGTLDSKRARSGDGMPSNDDLSPGPWVLVDLRYTMAAPGPVTIMPTNSLNFVNGVWSGNITVPQPASNVVLVAAHSTGRRGTSNPFVVRETETTPPVLNCPTNQIAVALPGQCEANVTFSVTATDNSDPAPVVTCVPPSGSSFPVGRTTVLCTAVDFSGNTNTGSFTVSVYPNGGLVPAGETWTPRESDRNWSAVASSADGTKLVASADGGGLIYTSTDSGTSWTATSAPGASWTSVGSSADGTRLIAGVWSGQIYTSTDSGLTWTARESNRNWLSVGSSADGTKLVAAADGGQLYTSTDSGTTWTARESARDWKSVASSADGSKLVAGAWGGQLYTSTDSGLTWMARESNRNWDSLASSADGTRLVAVPWWGQIYTLTDSGTNWTARDSWRNWVTVASSTNGTKLVAAEAGGQIYISVNSGVNWTARASARNWKSVASSADGTKLVAVVQNGQIYTSVQSSIPLMNPPAILGATNQVVAATGPGGAVLTFNVTAINACQPNVPVTCMPPSGSTFPLGTNIVNCQAVDALGVTNTASFTVTVILPALPVFAGCSVPATGQFRLCATGTAGLTYTLQTSSNLVDWVDHTNLLADPEGLIDWLMDMDADAPTCYYRLKWP